MKRGDIKAEIRRIFLLQRRLSINLRGPAVVTQSGIIQEATIRITLKGTIPQGGITGWIKLFFP